MLTLSFKHFLIQANLYVLQLDKIDLVFHKINRNIKQIEMQENPD